MNTLKELLPGLVMAMTATALSTGAYANNMHFAQYKKRSITVRYGDLNLSHQAGVAMLYNRIRRAGHEVCGPVYTIDPYNLAQDWRDWNACYNQALNNAAASVDNQKLSQMVYDRTRSPMTTVAERG